MHSLHVGELYNPERTNWPETAQLRLGPQIAELVVFLATPTSDEVAQHQRGPAAFALVDLSPDLLVLVCRFGALDWFDVPFQAHRMTTAQRGVPELTEDGELWLRHLLVEAQTGVVRALRQHQWRPELAVAAQRAVTAQLTNPFDDGRAGRMLDMLYDQFGTSQDLVTEIAEWIQLPQDDDVPMTPPSEYFYGEGR